MVYDEAGWFSKKPGLQELAEFWFWLHDADADGTLSFTECYFHLVDPNQANRMAEFDAMDRQKDGKISIDEYMNYINDPTLHENTPTLPWPNSSGNP